MFGFTNMLAKLLKDHVGTHLAVIFDAGARPSATVSTTIQGARPPPPDELIPQFELVRKPRRLSASRRSSWRIRRRTT